jgi:hypothetical protein
MHLKAIFSSMHLELIDDRHLRLIGLIHAGTQQLVRGEAMSLHSECEYRDRLMSAGGLEIDCGGGNLRLNAAYLPPGVTAKVVL